MRSKKMFWFGLMVSMLILFSFPVSSLAAEKIPTVQIPKSVTDTIPGSSEISDNPNYSESTSGPFGTGVMVMAAKSSVSGGCRITKLSSSRVQISGYSITSPSAPGLKVTLQLQAYYDGAWQTLITSSNRVDGTRVDLTKTYNVTSGFYYRVFASHALADGAYTTSKTNSVYVG